ncbi:tetratricopeptide repeat-containing sulfotransferase family protein [Roseospira goensis]|uniref:Tetratricopeptide (TPR) repeat protein n=1 Tax=Roseospira goensis TaxID=391922 RepID=A0A7W6RYF8_9PROT|nr:tetratricopeptide repeat-containing sulfotransferase family protein [Roseospira goensis]MBB4285548.1 tetratricopeptide (TPR) repeat protein [Roseospira goensis]
MTQPSKQAADALRQAVAAHRAGRHAEAERGYRAVLAVAADDPMAHHNLGVLAVQTGRAAAGLPHLQKAVEVSPDTGQYWVSLADGLLRSGRVADAARVLEQALSRGLDPVAARTVRARITAARTGEGDGDAGAARLTAAARALREGRFAQAEAEARAATRLKPSASAGWTVLAAARRGLGRWDGALAAARRAVALAPGDAAIVSNLGVLELERGQADHGLDLLSRARRLDPAYAEAAFNLGNGLAAVGRPDDAAAAYRAALALHPTHAQALNNLGTALQAAGRPDAAVAALTWAVRVAPTYAAAHYNLAHALLDAGCRTGAARAFEMALVLRPDLAEAWNNLANLRRDDGRLDEAIACYRHAVHIRPTYAEALTNLGGALRQDPAQAEALCRRALALAPRLTEARITLGAVLAEKRCFEDATICYMQAAMLRPADAGAYVGLAHALSECGLSRRAAAIATRAIRLDPLAAEGHRVHAAVLREEGQVTAAVGAARRAATLAPDVPEVWVTLALCLQTAGDLAAAEMAFRRAVALVPGHPRGTHGLYMLARAGPTESAFGLIRTRLDDPATPPSDRVLLHFALGKMNADVGAHDTAFAHYLDGHRWRAAVRGHTYQAAAQEARFLFRRSLFTPAYFRARAQWGDPSRRPIFIVGMPRSGTTLTEQVLASHSRVYGAGELRALNNIAADLFDQQTLAADAADPRADFGDRMRTAARRYLDYVGFVSGGSERVTDKMPHNFELLWLVALLFPHATVLHCVRSPVDTCLSCFFQNFTNAHTYTDDLSSLGHHYRLYQAYMRLWKQVLPMRIHDVVYEDLVSDPKAAISRLLDDCQLSFEPQCLDFHRTDRPVKTASVAQVRKRVYTTSVETWRRYEAHLGPLLQALETPLAFERASANS